MGNDQELWAAVVAADQQVARVRADFHQQAEARREVLADALRGSSRWECGAALSFLEGLPDDVPELLDQLVELATSHAWALAARRAIASGRPPEVVQPLLRQIIDRRLLTADADDFRRLAQLLQHLNDKEALEALVQRASGFDDPDMREVVEDFSLE